jgi:hypothetical protein
MKNKPASDAAPGGDHPAGARRRFPRYPLDIRVSIHLLRSGEVISLWGRSNEMGRDGIGATLTGQLEPGEVVSLELTVPRSSYPMKIRALVRYRDGLRHGFEFLTLTAQQREAVDAACETLAAR